MNEMGRAAGNFNAYNMDIVKLIKIMNINN